MFLLFCVCWHQDNRLCHPTLCFVATPSVSKIVLYPTDITGIHMERAWRAWVGAVSGCESSSVSACVTFVFALAHLVCDLCTILMSCFLVLSWSPPKTQPTGSLAAVSQPLSRSSLSHQLVCLRVLCCGAASYLLHACSSPAVSAL